MSPIPVFDEVSLIANASHQPIGGALGTISSTDLEEIRSLVFNPPPVVQRTLEVACLVLNAGKAVGRPLGLPDWKSVQRTLTSADFPSRVLEYDVERLRMAPGLCAYVMKDYFKCDASCQSDSPVRRRSPACAASPAAMRRTQAFHEPLTLARVRRASQAAAALFSWCVETLEAAEAVLGSEGTTPAEITAKEVVARVPSLLEALKRPLPAESMVEAAVSARPRPKAKMRPSSAHHLKNDRYFECLVAFPGEVCSAGLEQVRQLRLLASALKQRPNLVLHLAKYSSSTSTGLDTTAEQRLYSVQLFFEAEHIPFVCMPAEEANPHEGRGGVLCTLHMDNDEELFKCIKQGPQKSVGPTCPRGHMLHVRLASANCACDACSLDLQAGKWIFGCECHSLCDSCFQEASLGDRDPNTVKFSRWLCDNFSMR